MRPDACGNRAWPPRWRSRPLVATPSRTRHGCTIPTGLRGRSMSFFPMPARRTSWDVGRRPASPAADVLVSHVALWRRLAAELIGSAFLAAVVIGSGLAAQQLSPGNVGLELLENALAT